MPVLLRALVLLAFTVLVVGGIVVSIAVRRVGRTHDLPLPVITRATIPSEIARGDRLFRTNCLDCHAGATGAPGPTGLIERRPIGARVMGAPSFLGEIWAPNLTAHPQAGIGAWTDGELARLLRNGVRRDGRYAGSMPRFGHLADDDAAALIGFLRSGDPLVAPDPHQVPRPGLGLAGTLALAFAAGVDVSGDAHVPMPPRAATADYGRYLASAVYGCVDCHTDGFSPTDQNLRSPNLLAGGLFLRTPRGEPIYSRNLTPHPVLGIAAWTAGDLARALTTGIGPKGLSLRPPMPVFRYLDTQEAEALFAYLRSIPPVERKTPGPERERPGPDMPLDRLFAALGCSLCHGDGAPHRDTLKRAAALPLAEIAASIRNPETRNPATQMPTYAAVVDEAMAARLAGWIQSTRGEVRSPSSPGKAAGKGP
ncbi:MAG: cytochrome c [Bacteroidota bacterium]